MMKAITSRPFGFGLAALSRLAFRYFGDISRPVSPRAGLSRRGVASTKGHIALVGAGPGAADLLTLRALRHLQQADVILYDRLVEPEVLNLVPTAVRRIFVGKHVGANSWPQCRINQLMVDEALMGHRVVRLKSGDPSIFGRAAEELAAARDHGIAVEIVPGITAASAAAAALGRPLTERGETDALLIATGTGRPGDMLADWTAAARPGTTSCFYMAIENAAVVQLALIRAGVCQESRVEIVASASTDRQRCVTADLHDLAATIAREQLSSPAIILVRQPKLTKSKSSTNTGNVMASAAVGLG